MWDRAAEERPQPVCAAAVWTRVGRRVSGACRSIETPGHTALPPRPLAGNTGCASISLKPTLAPTHPLGCPCGPQTRLGGPVLHMLQRSDPAPFLAFLQVDPKSDGAARDWVAIYDECSRILYQEIDYRLEGANADRFR